MSPAAQACARRLNALQWEEAREEIEQMARARKSATDRLLLELFSSRSVRIREVVLNALLKFGSLATARQVARLGIKHKNFFVRDAAVEALEEVGTKRDAAALIHVLQNDSHWVARASAASSLGSIRTKAAIRSLRKALSKDHYWCVRAYAADALARTADREQFPLLLTRLKRDPNPATRVGILYSLTLLGEEQHWDTIIDVLEEPDQWYTVYLRACSALQARFIDGGAPIPPRLFAALEKVMTYDVGKAAFWSAEKLLAKLRGEAV